jgi:hypothetical protein
MFRRSTPIVREAALLVSTYMQHRRQLCPEVILVAIRLASAGNAGSLARTEREARTA